MSNELANLVIDGRYLLHEELAAGAMGAVYRATRLSLDRAVAIKVMHASLPDAMEGRARFERESKLMARLEHPHCVSIIDFGIHADKPYVVMELVRGRSLFDTLVEQRRIEVPRAVDILQQILSGLAHAHEQDIVHRDIKPANIMLTPKAPLGVHVRILDFGLARMLGTGSSLTSGFAVGTPSYMSPEQCRGDQVDARADLYACGIVLFEMLTGHKPFSGPDPIATVRMHLERPPPRLADVAPGSYGALEDVIARALAKAPGDRFASAVAMAEAVSAAASGRQTSEPTAVLPQISSSALRSPSSVDVPITVASSVTAPPPPPAKPRKAHDSSIRKLLPRSRIRWVALAIVAMLAGGVYGAVRWLRAPGPTPAPDAPQVAMTPDATIELAAPDRVAEIVAKADALAASGRLQQAIDSVLAARGAFPDRAELPLAAGRLYFSKLWWTDGIANFRAAIKLDPSLREDPELLKLALRGFLTTPQYDGRLGQFLLELGAPLAPMLEETAASHPNPDLRARAASLLRRVTRR